MAQPSFIELDKDIIEFNAYLINVSEILYIRKDLYRKQITILFKNGHHIEFQCDKNNLETSYNVIIRKLGEVNRGPA